MTIDAERLARDWEEVGLAKGEIQSAAVCGVDVVWGYADNQNAEQCSQIEVAEHNIRVAILMAVRGQRLSLDQVKDY